MSEIELKAKGSLLADGIELLPKKLRRVDEFRAHLACCPTYEGHTKAYGDGELKESVLAYKGRSGVLSHRLIDVMEAPDFLLTALTLTPYVAGVLEADVRMYSLNAMWTRRVYGPTNPHIQEWHKDDDDDKGFIALFMYGTDMLAEDQGPHQYVVGSHMFGDNGAVIATYGDAGTMFFEQPRGIHRGLRPTCEGWRLLAWARWGVSEIPKAYEYDKTEPVKLSELSLRVQELVKDKEGLMMLLVDYDS